MNKEEEEKQLLEALHHVKVHEQRCKGASNNPLDPRGLSEGVYRTLEMLSRVPPYDQLIRCSPIGDVKTTVKAQNCMIAVGDSIDPRIHDADRRVLAIGLTDLGKEKYRELVEKYPAEYDSLIVAMPLRQ